MNWKQRVTAVLYAGAVLVLGIGWVPWRGPAAPSNIVDRTPVPQSVGSTSYAPIFAPPGPRSTLDVPRLGSEVLAITLATGALLLSLRRRHRGPAQWFREARSALTEFQLVASRAARIRERNGHVAEELKQRIRERADKLTVVLSSAELYFPVEFCKQMRKTVIGIYMVAKGEEDPWSYMAETAHHTATTVANEARSETDLEPLPGNWEGVRTPVRSQWSFPDTDAG